MVRHFYDWIPDSIVFGHLWHWSFEFGDFFLLAIDFLEILRLLGGYVSETGMLEAEEVIVDCRIKLAVQVTAFDVERHAIV